MALQLVTGPAVEPVTFDEVVAGCKISEMENRDYVNGLIKAARAMAEQRLGRSLITQTWRKTVDVFGDPWAPYPAIRLDMPRIQSVTSVKYIDLDGVQQTLDPTHYYLDAQSEPGWLLHAYGVPWPVPLDQANAVEVIYVAGFGPAATDVPDDIKAWIKVMFRHMYDSPTALAEGRVLELSYLDGLLDRYTVMRA